MSLEKLTDQVADLYVQIAERDPALAVQIATGAFVSLLVSYLKANGQETDIHIRVDGGNNRDITVHAPKKPEQQHKGEA